MKIAALFTLLLFSACMAGGPPEDDRPPQPSPPADTPAAAVTVIPPEAPADTLPGYDTTRWRELRDLDTSIRLDLRYATTDNFVGEVMYECGRCFLRPEVARAIVAAQRELQAQGLGLKMYDCYRPRPVQWKLWNKVPDRRYVADPRKGSVHNRGGAVDLTLVDSTGTELPMGTPYDFFGREAWPSYTNLPDNVLANRRRLQELMKRHGFRPTNSEWWHFSYAIRSYPLDDWQWPCP